LEEDDSMSRDDAFQRALNASVRWYMAKHPLAFEYGRSPLRYTLPAAIDAGQLVAMLEALGLLDFNPKEEAPVDGKTTERTVPRYPEAEEVIASININDPFVRIRHPTDDGYSAAKLGDGYAKRIVYGLERAGFKIVRIRPDAQDE
jgi:hypothetical protein